MSSLTTGQALGSLVGFGIGWMFGQPLLGMSIGGQVGLWIDPPDAPNAPPLGDVNVNSYVRNAPLAIAYGNVKTYGGVIWIGEIEVSMENQGSKKSPNYQPNVDVVFAVAHCEGPIVQYIQYFVDEKTVSEFLDDSEGFSIDFESYLGTSDQLVNSRIEAWQLGSSAPANPIIYTAYSIVDIHYEATLISSLSSIAAEIEGFLTESGEEDANTIRVLYDFMTNKRYGMGYPITLFNGDPDTVDSPWKNSSDQCDELVSYIDENDDTIYEPRFRYSNYLSDKTKGFDIIIDILLSCRGILRWKQGLLEPKIETANEVPEFYFSDLDEQVITTGSGHTVDTIYANFSDFPDHYFEDAAVIINGVENAVYEQTSTYIKLCEDLDSPPDNGISITLIKDNIKEGSFSFKRVSSQVCSQRVHVEFINRKIKVILPSGSEEIQNKYQWDLVTYDLPDIYSVYDAYGEVDASEINEKTVRISGIKRKSQAIRMAQFFGDFAKYSPYECEFTTDIVGFLRAIGDIIGISHTLSNWNKKAFRIVDMEELEEGEVKIHCLEYNSDVYNDNIPYCVETTSSGDLPSPYELPDQSERLNIIQDLSENKIYVCFKRPDDVPYYYGVQVFAQKGALADYTYVTAVSSTTPSVKLSSGIDDSQTTIAFDDSTLYGSFPSSGSFWIEDELITYTGISSNQFTGCTRGTNATSHTSDKYCDLKQDKTPFITFEDSDVGFTWTVKVISVNVSGITSSFSTAPSDSLVIV